MKLWICILLIALHLTAISIVTFGSAALSHSKCVRSYKKLGCFNAWLEADSKLLNTLLITDRDQRSAQNDGHALDWNNWEAYTHSLACRCAEAARKRGFKVFGLQNYGECWSGSGAEKTYDHAGRSNECLMILQKPLAACDMSDPRECVGAPRVNFIYELSGCPSPGIYDLGLIIDGSGSMGNYDVAQTKLFLLQLINQFHVSFNATHIGAIVYSGKPELICTFADSRYYDPISLKLRLLGLEFPDGSTRTDKALRMVGRELYSDRGGDRIHVPNVLAVITDGDTDPNSEPYKDVLKPLKDRGVNTIAVGVGNDASRDELIKIAMGRNDRVIQADTIEHLNLRDLREMIYKTC